MRAGVVSKRIMLKRLVLVCSAIMFLVCCDNRKSAVVGDMTTEAEKAQNLNESRKIVAINAVKILKLNLNESNAVVSKNNDIYITNAEKLTIDGLMAIHASAKSIYLLDSGEYCVYNAQIMRWSQVPYSISSAVVIER